jgi:hypothetical protein
MTPTRPALTVTPLEDRCVPVSLGAAQTNILAAILFPPPGVVTHAAPAPWAVHVGTGAVGLMGLRPNRNETFVRRTVR